MKILVFSFLVLFSFNFLFSQPKIKLDQDDPFLGVKIFKNGEFIFEFTTLKSLISANLETPFQFQMIYLYTNNDYAISDLEDSPTLFYDFQDGVPDFVLKKNIFKEIFDREENYNPRDNISVAKFFF